MSLAAYSNKSSSKLTSIRDWRQNGLEKRTIFSVWFLHGMFFLAFPSYSQNIPKIYKKALPSIVKISTISINGFSGHGTGFFIDEKTILTCYHVVDYASKIEIKTNDGKQFTVDSIIASNKEADLIKFTVKEKNNHWLKLSKKLPTVGEPVVVIGNPGDSDFSLSNGLVSGIKQHRLNQVIQTNASIAHGNSGGPLIDKNGKVIGVLSYVKFTGENISFAATSLDALNLINDHSITQLISYPKTLTQKQVDSILEVSHRLISSKKFQEALDIILPIGQNADSNQSLIRTEQIANCYFFLRDYLISVQYLEMLIDKLQEKKPKSPDMVATYAQALSKAATCHFMIGDKNGAVEILEKAADVSLAGYQNDDLRKEIYIVLLQQIYSQDALYKYTLDKKFEACLSWKKAKDFGFKFDDFNLDNICK